MHEEQDEKRKSGRRQKTRRVADLLEDSISEEEKQRYDWMRYRAYRDEDRRVSHRRTGVDRREKQDELAKK